MANPFSIIFKHYDVLFFVVWSDLRKRYAGSLLGVIWLVVYPIIFLAIYASIYLFVFKVKIPELSHWSYVLVIFSGLVPYLGFSESLQQGSQSLIQNANLLKNTVFPIELIPVKTVLCSQVAYGVTLGVLGVFVLAGEGAVSHRLWLVPVAFVIQFFLIQGLAWIFSPILIILKDTQQVLNLGLLLLLFISPIAFTPDVTPPAFRIILYFNPLYYLISIYRAGFFEGQPFLIFDFLILCVGSFLLFLVGFSFFRKLQTVLAEYV